MGGELRHLVVSIIGYVDKERLYTLPRCLDVTDIEKIMRKNACQSIVS